jgi:hypothetical protein
VEGPTFDHNNRSDREYSAQAKQFDLIHQLILRATAIFANRSFRNAVFPTLALSPPLDAHHIRGTA